MKKILVTLGPASLNTEAIKEMTNYAPYVFRLNMSHVSLEQLPEHIKLIQANSPVPVCIDSEGAQIRTHVMQDNAIHLKEGAKVEILAELTPGTAAAFSLTPAGIASSLQEGDIVRLDWYGAAIQIISVKADKAIGTVLHGGAVASCKAVDVNRHIKLAAITPKDKEALAIGQAFGVQHFALSFANAPDDVREFRSLAGPGARIISKLESESALRMLPAILQETDEALIDRGDLSRAVPLEKVPFLQMRMIAVARSLDRPIYVATNLLESMIENGLPTRAELNDIASSILMGASGLVLAAETAAGRHPVQTVAMARKMLNMCKKWTMNSTITDILAM